MGITESISKEKKDIDIILKKLAALEKVCRHFTSFLGSQITIKHEWARNLKTNVTIEKIEEVMGNSNELNSCLLVSYINSYLNLMAMFADEIQKGSTEQYKVFTMGSLVETLGLKQTVLTDNTTFLITGLDQTTKNYFKTKKDYEKLCEKAEQYVVNLEKSILNPSDLYNLGEMIKKKTLCHETVNEISNIELQINEQIQVINTKFYACSTIIQTSLTEIKEFYLKIVNSIFHNINECNKHSYLEFSKSQETAREHIKGLNLYLSQEKSFLKEDQFLIEIATKFYNNYKKTLSSQKIGEKEGEEKPHIQKEITSEEFKNGISHILDPNDKPETFDILFLCDCAQMYCETIEYYNENCSKLYKFLVSKIESNKIITEEVVEKSKKIFKSNGMSNDSDSFYTQMLKSFNTQVIFAVKNYISLFEVIKKKSTVLGQVSAKAMTSIETMLKDRAKELGKLLPLLKGRVQQIHDVRLAYSRVSSDAKNQESNAENSHALIIKSNLEKLIHDALQDAIKCRDEIRKVDSANSGKINKLLESVFLSLFELSEETIKHCGLVSTLQSAFESIDDIALLSIKVDKDFFKLFESKTQFDKTNQLIFEGKLDVEKYSLRLLNATKIIQSAHPHFENEEMKMDEQLIKNKNPLPLDLVTKFQVSENEQVKGKFNCVFMNGVIPHAGNLWVLSKKLCFHSAMAVLSKDLDISWSDITSYEKKKFGPFDNGLVVKTRNGDISFGGILDRDFLLRLIDEICKTSVHKDDISDKSSSIEEEKSDQVNDPELPAKEEENKKNEIENVVVESEALKMDTNENEKSEVEAKTIIPQTEETNSDPVQIEKDDRREE